VTVLPTATFTAPATVAAGQSFTLTLSDAQVPGHPDVTFTYAFDCGDGLGYAAASTTSSRSCPTSSAGSRSVKGRVIDQDGDEAEYTATVEVTPAPQTIAFTSTPPSPAYVGGSYAVSASGGGSGNPVTFSSLTGATCIVSGATVSLLATGDCTVAADQAGSESYEPAPRQTQTFAVVQRGGQIGFCGPGYWQGGAGSQRWNVANDPNWGGFHAQPYTHATAFFGRTNPYTSPFSRNRIPTADIANSMTMMDIIGTGGTSNSAQRAARSVIAAYLNASSKQEGYPLTRAVIVSRWNTAASISNAAERNAALDRLHNELDDYNNEFDCR
jgi:hypothetical protein